MLFVSFQQRSYMLAVLQELQSSKTKRHSRRQVSEDVMSIEPSANVRWDRVVMSSMQLRDGLFFSSNKDVCTETSTKYAASSGAEIEYRAARCAKLVRTAIRG